MGENRNILLCRTFGLHLLPETFATFAYTWLFNGRVQLCFWNAMRKSNARHDGTKLEGRMVECASNRAMRKLCWRGSKIS